MDAYAQQDTLVKQSTIAALVFSRGIDVALVTLSGLPDVEVQSAELMAAGFNLEGIVGLVGENVQIAPTKPFDPMCMFAMGRAVTTFSELVSGQPQQTKGDSVAWCEKLLALPDTRTREKFGRA